MIELFWLLLPVAAASGWWASRRYSTLSGRQLGTQGINSDYLRGLNYLLNEQTDKAIEVFIRLVEVDQDTVETHLALGHLFRRRGEVERAIRIHQNLIARPNLSEDLRLQALLDLGKDFLSAGLLDRAEDVLLELVELVPDHAAGWRLLADIYQQEREWEKAIGAACRIEQLTQEVMGPVIAHYHCELAEALLNTGNWQQAEQRLEQAHATHPESVRSSLLLGQAAALRGDWRAVIRALERVERQDVRFLAETIAPMQLAYSQLGLDDVMLAHFTRLANQYDVPAATLAVAELLDAQQGPAAAIAFLLERARRSQRGVLNYLVEADERLTALGRQSDCAIQGELLSRLLQEEPCYQCAHCGFRTRGMHWQCPGCKRWNSITGRDNNSRAYCSSQAQV